jgi:hypothetical protein
MTIAKPKTRVIFITPVLRFPRVPLWRLTGHQ